MRKINSRFSINDYSKLASNSLGAKAAVWEARYDTRWLAGVRNGKPRSGQMAERSRTTCQSDIETFFEMTGDRNPLHYDRGAAERSVFGKLIVQGGVTSGILNAIVAEDLPGPGPSSSASSGGS